MKIGIKDAQFFAYHGYFEEERKFGNHFIVNLEVVLKDDAYKAEDLSSTIDYKELYLVCKRQMGQPQLLLETVLDNILSECYIKWPLIVKAKVRIDKMGPQLGGPLASSFVELER